MPSGPAFTFIAIASLVASALGSIHPTGRATLARRHSRVVEARANNGKFVLEDDFRGHNFFDGFNFFTEKDPTNGMVNYVDRQTAFANNLSYVNQNGQAVIRVDRTSYLEPGQYRNSVRIHSKKNYGNGLIVLDLAAMPSNKCSQWAAFWMNSGEKQWPYGGEVDVIEGVNNGNTNAMTLHTSDGCHLDTSPDARSQFSGEVHATNCNAFQNGNAGCGIGDTDPLSYGHEFNVRGGGVFVTLMDDSGIRIWRFGRNEIPADLADGAIPDPESWPQPKAFWSKNSCSREFIDQKQMIIFNITLCGDWAGSVYNMMGCQGTCADAVRDPSNYKWARFAVNSLRVFKHA